ncbi:MAG: glycosyltransferase family 1 protein [Candidatus Andersenbacteria bacterium]
MRIGFDISDLATNRADGTTRYTRELAERLPTAAAHDEWHFFTPAPVAQYQPAPHVHLHISPWPKYWTQLRLPGELYKHQPDVLFMPIQQIPYLRPKKMRTVAVIHDLAVHRYPQQFRYKDWALLHTFSAYVAREATAIIAVSQATADDIERYYGRTAGVHIIHHGVDQEKFSVPTPDERERHLAALTAHYSQLHRPYILYVGQIQPRKNLERLIEAFEIINPARPELQLVIAGGHGWLQRPILRRVQASPIKERILLTGPVPDDLLPVLYWHAEVFVLPSLYEGFGMPVLEAMACGCPVVVANVSALPEVAGGAAILVEPESAESIADGITTALTQRSELVDRGLKRVQLLSWEATTSATLQVLHLAGS